MKKILLSLSFLLLLVAAQAQTINFNNMCVLNIALDTAHNEMDVTIYNGDTNHVNYPTVVVTNTTGDTIGNINNLFYLFAHMPGDTVTHSIPTTLDSLPAGFTCSVYFTDQVWDITYMFSYPMICSVGINEQYASNNIRIFPNPAEDNITIDLDKNSSMATIAIYDITGKQVRTYSTTSDKLNINRDGLTSGMYFLNILANDKRYSSKLLIK